MSTHEYNLAPEQMLEEQLKHETSIATLATVALSSDLLEATLQELCERIAQVLNFKVVQVIDFDWSSRSSQVLLNTGQPELDASASQALAAFASTVVGQLVVSDLGSEARFRVEPTLLKGGLVSAMALCSAEASGTTFTVLSGFGTCNLTKERGKQEFFVRATDIVARVVRRETERKELRERSARYTSLFDNAADAILCIGIDGRIVDANPSAVGMLGYTHDELVSRNVFDLLTSESQAMTRKMIEEKTGGRRRTIYEATFLGKGGTLIPAEVNSSVIRKSEGEIIAIQGIVRDLRSRKRAEEALIASESRFRSVVESEMIGIVFWNADGWITDANQTFLSMLGYSHEEINRRELHWDTVCENRGNGSWFGQRLRGQQKIRPLEIECIQKGGTCVPVLIGGATLDGMDGGVGFVLDITERKQLQKQFQHAQKMEAVGQLAAGIAHDFNNILMGISSFAELLHVMSASEPKKQAYTQQILAASARAAELVEQLLVFSAKRSSKAERVNLVRTLQESNNLLRQILGPKCELKMNLCAGSCNVIGDPVQLQQVILNLASNARDAMSSGGTFRVSVAKINLLKPKENQNVMIPAGSYALLTFSDSGAGIKPELINRIFEPFFTTKPTGEGTGLGLAMVYGIVKQCGGYIFVESEQGSGTVFRLFLPMTAKESSSWTKPAHTSFAPVHGAGVLLVDDELQIRLSCAEYLREQGYEVFEAGEAGAALDLFAAHSERIQVLVSDVVMPGMGGKELAMGLRKRNPHLPILFMSGYTANNIASSKELSSVKMLMKPVALSDLGEAIAQALRSNRLEEEVIQ